MEDKLEQWRVTFEDRGLKISRKKMEYMSFNESQNCEMRIQEMKLKSVDKFKPGLRGNGDRNLDEELAHRIHAGWINWRKMSEVYNYTCVACIIKA